MSWKAGESWEQAGVSWEAGESWEQAVVSWEAGESWSKLERAETLERAGSKLE